jgi:hypothetical protein
MHEIPLYPLWVTLFLTIWAVIGPIIGIVAGHLLTRSWQKKQWLMDNKRDEYRDVIRVLCGAIRPILHSSIPGALVTPEMQKERFIAETLSYEVLGSRLFISDNLEELHAPKRWGDMVTKFNNSRDSEEFSKGFKKLLSEIRAQALRSIGVK